MRGQTVRSPLPALLFLGLTIACSDPPPDVRVTASGLRVPAEVIRLAEQYVASLPWPQDREAVRSEYLKAFFRGFIHPDRPARFDPARPQHAAIGFRAGQGYRRAHADKIEETMRGFGYVAVTAEGSYTTGFETSWFEPRGQPEQDWWVRFMADSRLGPPEDGPTSRLGFSLPVRVTGFLSQPGRYGHLGAYDHELLVTSIVPLGR